MKPFQNMTIPLEAQYLYKRGLEMAGQKKEDAALTYLRQAVFIAPHFSKAYRELGFCLARLGRPEEASACLGKAYRIDPDHGLAAGDTTPLKVPVEDERVCSHFLTSPLW